MKWILLIAVYCTLITSCASPPTAAGVVAGQATAHPAVIATAQADQYLRDAQATTQAQQAMLEANYRNVQATAEAATATYQAQMAQATATTGAAIAQATATASYQQTADALNFAMTAEAATAQAQALAMEATRQSVEATATYQAQATAASFQATRTAFEIEQVQSAARREETKAAIVFGIGVLLSVTVIGLGIYLLILAWPLIINRLKMMKYGQHGNPLFVEERNGRTILTDPLRMLQAGAVIDENGNLLMPELSPNEAQVLVAARVLQVLRDQAQYAPGHAPVLPNEVVRRWKVSGFEREETTRHDSPIISRPTPPGLPAPAPLPQLSAVSSPVPMPHMPTGHVMIIGPTDAGKSTTMRAVVVGRPTVIVLDPHAAPGDWPNASQVIGGGSNFQEINEFMIWMMKELLHRSQLRARGVQTFDPLTVATDEMPAIADELGKGAEQVWKKWVRQGRKFGLFFVVSTQSTRVKSLGIEGESDLLENFKYVLLLGETAVGEYPDLVTGMKRPAVLKTLEGVRPVIIPHVPTSNDTPTTALAPAALPYHNPAAAELPAPTGMDTQWGNVTPEQVSRILGLTQEGKSGRHIENEVFGYPGGNAWKMRTAVLHATATGDGGEFRPLQ